MLQIGLEFGLGQNRQNIPSGPAPHVFVVAGESNASGRAPEDGGQVFPTSTREWGALDGWTAPGSRLYHGPWEIGALAEPAAGANFGWARSFATAYAAAHPDNPVYLIGVAREGSGLDNGQWSPGNPAYDAALARVNAALAAAPGNAVLKGILWHQGETDSQSQQAQDGYAAALADLAGNLRAGITGAGLATPFVAGGHFPASSHYHAKIQAATQALPNQVAHTGYADPSTPQEVELADGRHADAASATILGQNYLSALALAESNASLSPAGSISMGALARYSLPSTTVSSVAGVALGTPDTTRMILVAIFARKASAVYPKAVSIDGIALSRVGTHAVGSSAAATALYCGLVPAGTSGTLSVTFNTSPTTSQAGAIVLPVYGMRRALALAGGHATAQMPNGATSISTTVSAHPGDLIFAAAGGYASTLPSGSLNLAQSTTGPAAGTSLALTGGAGIAAAETADVTCTFDRGVNGATLNVAVFRPI